MLIGRRRFAQCVIAGTVAAVSTGLPKLLTQQQCYAADLDSIQQRGYLLVAVKDNRKPLGFRDANGELVGMEIDIARRLAQELLGKPQSVELNVVMNRDRLRSVMDGHVDLAIAAITATPNRSRLVSFSTPYYLDGTAILTSDRTVKQLGDLTNRSIAVLEGSTAVAVLRHTLPSVRLLLVASYQVGADLLADGKVDGFAGDASVLAGWVQDVRQYHLLPSLLTIEPLCIAMPKGIQYDPLRRRVNQLLTAWQENGWLRQQANRWGLP